MENKIKDWTGNSNGVFMTLGATSHAVGAVCYAWFVWEKGFKGKPQLEWIN